MTLKIGVSARLHHPTPEGKGVLSKTLQYLEQSLASWVMSHGVLLLMVPAVEQGEALHRPTVRAADYADALDGLVLQGGADVSPAYYGEAPLRPEWAGDPVRDAYEIDLVRGFVAAGKPVLGICRGLQLINVAFGGALFQDIGLQVPGAGRHRHDSYEKHRHEVRFAPGSRTARLFGDRRRATVSSIHHQSVKTVGEGLQPEAWSEPDGVIEALRGTGKSYLLGVQWHPEFHPPGDGSVLDSAPLMEEFLRAARGG